jgi:hypothetical protein
MEIKGNNTKQKRQTEDDTRSKWQTTRYEKLNVRDGAGKAVSACIITWNISMRLKTESFG